MELPLVWLMLLPIILQVVIPSATKIIKLTLAVKKFGVPTATWQ